MMGCGRQDVWNYFHYDARMFRYAVQDSGGLRYFTWDENGMNLLCERDPSGAVTRRYTHGPTPIAGIGSVVESEDVGTAAFKYPHTDHRGSVFATTDAAQAPKDAYTYNAWGETLAESESGFANRFGYQSNWLRLWDSGDILLSPTRTYEAETGRFGQMDIARHFGAPNLYLAFSDHPADVDPMGLRVKKFVDCPTPWVTALTAADATAETAANEMAEAFLLPTRDAKDILEECWNAPCWTRMSFEVFVNSMRRKVLNKVRDCIQNGITIECEDDCPAGRGAYVYPLGRNIHFCTNNLAGAGRAFLASLIVHEAAHHCAGLPGGEEELYVWNQAFDWTDPLVLQRTPDAYALLARAKFMGDPVPCNFVKAWWRAGWEF